MARLVRNWGRMSEEGQFELVCFGPWSSQSEGVKWTSEQHVVHVLFLYCMLKIQKLHVCVKRSKRCTVAALQHSSTSILQRGMSGWGEIHCAESTGGYTSVQLVSLPTFIQHFRDPPSASGYVSHADQAFACWSLSRCSCCASEACPLSHSNWCLGSGWSKVSSWSWGSGHFPFSVALESLPTFLFICLCLVVEKKR